MKIFVVFKKREEEKEHAYSLVDSEMIVNIDPELIHAKKQVKDKLYTTKELEKMRDELV